MFSETRNVSYVFMPLLSKEGICRILKLTVSKRKSISNIGSVEMKFETKCIDTQPPQNANWKGSCLWKKTDSSVSSGGSWKTIAITRHKIDLVAHKSVKKHLVSFHHFARPIRWIIIRETKQSRAGLARELHLFVSSNPSLFFVLTRSFDEILHNSPRKIFFTTIPKINVCPISHSCFLLNNSFLIAS